MRHLAQVLAGEWHCQDRVAPLSTFQLRSFHVLSLGTIRFLPPLPHLCLLHTATAGHALSCNHMHAPRGGRLAGHCLA